MVLTLSLQIKTDDLSPRAVSTILARPTFEGKVISQPFREFIHAQSVRYGVPIPATSSTLPYAKPDHDDAQSPPPLNHPHTWTLGASAPSEDLGTPQSNGMGAGIAGRYTAAAAADAEDTAADARGLTPTEFGVDDAQGPKDEAEEEAEEEAENEDAGAGVLKTTRTGMSTRKRTRRPQRMRDRTRRRKGNSTRSRTRTRTTQTRPQFTRVPHFFMPPFIACSL